MIRLSLLLGFVLATVLPARAATVTVNTPDELEKRIATAAPGDVVVLQNGTWTNTSIVLNRSGSPGKPITIRGRTPGGVVLTGASTLDFAGDWLVVEGLRFENLKTDRTFVVFQDEADFCRLTQTAIVDSSSDARWIHMQRGVSNRIDSCRFSGMNHRGVQLQVETETNRPNYHRIERNFFGNRARGNGNGFETIRIGYSHQQRNWSRTTVEGNVFYKCDGENEIISNKSTGNRLVGNTFLENRGELTLRHGDSAWVEGNWFLGRNVPGSGGVRVIGSDHVVINNYFSELRTYAILVRKGVNTTDVRSYTQARNALIAFNTIVDCRNSFVIGSGGGTLIPADCRIANNIAVHPSGTIVDCTVAPTNFVYEGNIVACQSVGLADTNGFVVTDPELEKGPDGIYRPGARSPARKAAVGKSDAVTRDISGNVRRNPTDTGAQVVSWLAREKGPLSEKDVGPSWWR